LLFNRLQAVENICGLYKHSQGNPQFQSVRMTPV